MAFERISLGGGKEGVENSCVVNIYIYNFLASVVLFMYLGLA